MAVVEPIEAAAIGLRILVVDDDVSVRRRIVEMLRPRKAQIALARSASEAQEMMHDAEFLELKFDALIVSDHLPDSSGWRVIDDFRMERPHSPVLLLSEAEDLALAVWSRARRVSVLRALDVSHISHWLCCPSYVVA